MDGSAAGFAGDDGEAGQVGLGVEAGAEKQKQESFSHLLRVASFGRLFQIRRKGLWHKGLLSLLRLSHVTNSLLIVNRLLTSRQVLDGWFRPLYIADLEASNDATGAPESVRNGALMSERIRGSLQTKQVREFHLCKNRNEARGSPGVREDAGDVRQSNLIDGGKVIPIRLRTSRDPNWAVGIREVLADHIARGVGNLSQQRTRQRNLCLWA